MNKKQRIVLLIGIILVLICGLFPPYEGELRDNVKQEIGYHFLFTSPSSEKIHNEIFSEYPEKSLQYEKSHAPIYKVNINTSRYWVQIVTIVFVTTGFVFYFSPDKHGNVKLENMQKNEKL